MRSSATGWSGILMPTVASPAVTMSGTIGLFSNIIVRGPGQKRSISRLAVGGTETARASTVSFSAMWTMRGSKRGRFFSLEYLCHSLRVEDVRPEAVNALRREGDNTALPEKPGRPLPRGRVKSVQYLHWVSFSLGLKYSRKGVWRQNGKAGLWSQGPAFP